MRCPRLLWTDRLGEVQDHIQAMGWKQCLVVNGAEVVLGRLRQEALDADATAVVETVMEGGATTIHPDTFLGESTQRMHERQMESIVVTTSDGRFVGILYHTDAERELHKSQGETPARL